MTIEIRDLTIAVIGIILAVLGHVSRQKTQKLKKVGIKAEGIVFSQEPEEEFMISFSTQNTFSTSYYPIIRFVTAEKEWVTQKYNVSSFPSYKEGDKVTVIYNPENITEFMLDDWSTQAVGYLFWLGILAIAMAAVLFAVGQ